MFYLFGNMEGKTTRNKNNFRCQSCSKVFLKQFDLIQHERMHTGEKPFSCEVCNRKFTQKSNMKTHLNTMHRVWPEALRTLRPISTTEIIENPPILYYCPFCTLSLKTYSCFKKHIVETHKNEKVYKCLNKDCLEIFQEVSDLIEHTKTHQQPMCNDDFEQKSNHKSFKCETCKVVFKKKEALQWHLSVESHNHVCPQCNVTYSAERHLRRHLAAHGRAITCGICNKSFKFRRTLKNHMFLHDPKNGFQCEICDKSFVNYFRLKRHSTVHSDKFLACTYRKKYGCEKRFSRRDKLLNHIRTHSKINHEENKDTEKVCDPAFIKITYEVFPPDS